MNARSRRTVEALSLEEAATSLGLHYMTVYRYIRLGRLPAEQRNGRWWIKTEDLENLAQPAPKGRGTRPGRFGRPRLGLVNRMLDGDAPGSWAIVEMLLGGGASPTDVYLHVLGPALREIGKRWESGQIDVGDEHRASAVAMRILGRLGPRFVGRGTPAAGTILIGGAPGDPHLIPAAMLADILRSRRFRVVDLGANVPAESFLAAIESIADLRAVGISVSDQRRFAETASVISMLHRSRPTLQILAGGPALTDRDSALELGADDWAPDGPSAADLLEHAG